MDNNAPLGRMLRLIFSVQTATILAILSIVVSVVVTTPLGVVGAIFIVVYVILSILVVLFVGYITLTLWPRLFPPKTDWSLLVGDYEWTIHNLQGTSATLRKSTEGVCQRNDASICEEVLYGDLDDNDIKLMKCTHDPGRIIDIKRRGKYYRVLVNLDKKFKRNEPYKFTLVQPLKEAFTTSHEWVEVESQSRTCPRDVCMRIKFPGGALVTNPVMTMTEPDSEGSPDERPLVIGKEVTGSQAVGIVIEVKVKFRSRNSQCTVEWDWNGGTSAGQAEEANPSVATTQPGVSTIKPGSVLIVTVTKVEAQAVLETFSPSAGRKWNRMAIGNKTYYNLGDRGSASIYMVQSEMGNATPGGALLTVRQAIQDLEPWAVIMCGVAFGLQPAQQSLGDILIARQIQYYEHQKINSNRGQFARGDRTTSSERLLDRFRSGDNDWEGAKTHFGVFVSGEKLANDVRFRDLLLKTEPEAIGGDMEGAGLYAAAREAKVDWILVKGICDWADGTKNDDAQPVAASNAAQFVLHVLQRGDFARQEALPPSSNGDVILTRQQPFRIR